MARASTVRRRRNPAGKDIEVDPRVEDAHVGFLGRWAGQINASQRAAWPDIRKLIVAEQKRLGTLRVDGQPRRRRRDADEPAIRSVNAALRDILDDYIAKVKSDEKGATGRATDIESGLERTSSDAWADNIVSKVNMAPGFSRDEKGLINEFLISEEPDIPKSVRRAWIKEQLGLISGAPVAPVRVAGKLIETISGRSQKRMRGIITRGIIRGTRVESVMKELSGLPGMTKRHAELIARDQVVKQNGRMTRIRHEAVGVTHYLWQTVGDDRVRKTHKAFGRRGRNRYSYKRGAGPSGVNPGEEIQCFPADTPIRASGILRITKRLWVGELAEFVSTSGVRLRSTPNHPVLTGRGWIGLGSLQRGDYVFEIVRDLARGRDDHEGVSCIGDLFESARRHGTAPITYTGGEFHGDSTDKQVDVVSVDGMFNRNLEARSDRGGLELRDAGSAKSRPSKSEISEMVVGLAMTAGGLVCGTDGDNPLVWTHHEPPGTQCCRPSSDMNLPLPKCGPYGVSVAPMPSGEFELGDTGLVVRAHLVDHVSSEEWTGHVFNVETTSGWYQAQGVVVSNCRCWASPDLAGALRRAKRAGLRGDSIRRLPRRVRATFPLAA